jgi:hypothetical protein
VTVRPCWTCAQPATQTLTREGSGTLHACDNCTRVDRAEAERLGWTIAPIGGTAPVETITHIRQRIVRKRGNGFYRVQYGPSENGSRTLCGDSPTDRDMGWGETRYAKNIAYVTCDECKRLRQT